MTSVLILGAGSIGNHLAHASKEIGWTVSVFDIDIAALQRMKEEIYPSRYGSWDNSILLLNEFPSDRNFDVCIVGTPPESTYVFAKVVLERYSPKILLIEKPLCTPDLDGLKEFEIALAKTKTTCLVGFNHNLAPSIEYAISLIKNSSNIRIEAIAVQIGWRTGK